MQAWQTWRRQPPHLSVAKFPQHPSVEQSVLLDPVDVLEPTLPRDSELRREDPGLGDFVDLLVMVALPLEPALVESCFGGGGTRGKTGVSGKIWALPVLAIACS